MAEAIVVFLQIVFGLLVIALVGLVWFTIYQVTNPRMKKFNKGWLHKRQKKKDKVL